MALTRTPLWEISPNTDRTADPQKPLRSPDAHRGISGGSPSAVRRDSQTAPRPQDADPRRLSGLWRALRVRYVEYWRDVRRSNRQTIASEVLRVVVELRRKSINPTYRLVLAAIPELAASHCSSRTRSSRPVRAVDRAVADPDPSSRELIVTRQIDAGAHLRDRLYRTNARTAEPQLLFPCPVSVGHRCA